MNVTIKEIRDLNKGQILELYKLNNWSSAEKPDRLYRALTNSHTLLSAWVGEKLVGIANAISDGYLVVYYPHMIVHPEFQRKGIGRKLMDSMQTKYGDFHQQMLTADTNSIEFYSKCGFKRAGKTEPMWIYQGNEH